MKKSALGPGRMKETSRISDIPHEPGIYRHVDNDSGAIDYVGQTNDLRKRQQEHARDERLDTSRQHVQYGVARNDDLAPVSWTGRLGSDHPFVLFGGSIA
jgi:hypothetical protein